MTAPTYPEYAALLAAAQASVRADGGFVDPAKLRGIQRLAGDPEVLHIEQAPEDHENNYSDRATLHGDIRWVVQGMSWARVGA